MIPNKIILVLSETDMKSYNLSINGLDIITVKKDVRHHNTVSKQVIAPFPKKYSYPRGIISGIYKVIINL